MAGVAGAANVPAHLPRRAVERLMEYPGIGRSLATRLARRGITTRAQLRKIIDQLPRGAQAHVRYNVARSIPGRVAAEISAALKERFTFKVAGRPRKFPVIAVGSVRRKAPRSKDLDFLVIVPEVALGKGVLSSAELAQPAAAPYLDIAETYAVGERRRSLIVRHSRAAPRYYAVDLFLATRKEKPFALFHFTGGRDYNIRVRAHAKRAGYRLNQYGLFSNKFHAGAGQKKPPGAAAIKTERDLARFLGVTYRPPEERSDAVS